MNNITRLIRHEDAIDRWRVSIYGEYLGYLWENADRIKNGNILFFDVEFYMGARSKLHPRLVVWHETNPPQSHRKHGIAWDSDTGGRAQFINAMYRARYIVGYNSRSLDFPALMEWGLNEHRILLKLVDLYEFVFWALSTRGTGSLDNISRINGGPGKYQRSDSSSREFQNQCERDVKILEHLFWELMEGKFETPRFGPLDMNMIWPCHGNTFEGLRLCMNGGVVP